MAIINGFKAVIDFLQAGYDYLRGIVLDGYRILTKIPDLFGTARSIINTLPSIFVTVGTFCLIVRTLVMIIHTKAGE